jgi:hypothetical protein
MAVIHDRIDGLSSLLRLFDSTAAHGRQGGIIRMPMGNNGQGSRCQNGSGKEENVNNLLESYGIMGSSQNLPENVR